MGRRQCMREFKVEAARDLDVHEYVLHKRVKSLAADPSHLSWAWSDEA